MIRRSLTPVSHGRGHWFEPVPPPTTANFGLFPAAGCLAFGTLRLGLKLFAWPNHAKHLPPVSARIKNANNRHSAFVRKIEDQEVLEVFYRPLPNADEIRIYYHER